MPHSVISSPVLANAGIGEGDREAVEGAMSDSIEYHFKLSASGATTNLKQ